MVGRARSPGSREKVKGRESGVPFLGGAGPTPAVPSFQKILRLQPRHPSYYDLSSQKVGCNSIERTFL